MSQEKGVDPLCPVQKRAEADADGDQGGAADPGTGAASKAGPAGSAVGATRSWHGAPAAILGVPATVGQGGEGDELEAQVGVHG